MKGLEQTQALSDLTNNLHFVAPPLVLDKEYNFMDLHLFDPNLDKFSFTYLKGYSFPDESILDVSRCATTVYEVTRYSNVVLSTQRTQNPRSAKPFIDFVSGYAPTGKSPEDE